MTEEWTAQATEVNGATLVALRLTEGALVYLDPMVASQFSDQIRAAVTVALYREEQKQNSK